MKVILLKISKFYEELANCFGKGAKINKTATICLIYIGQCDDLVVIVLGMAIDPPPRGNFGHYNFLIEQYLSHKMRHVSLLRSVALPCNIKITYVTQILLNYYLVSMVKYPQNQFH